MSKTIARRYLVSQQGWRNDEPVLALWNAAGTRVVFAGSISECRDFCAVTNAHFPIEAK